MKRLVKDLKQCILWAEGQGVAGALQAQVIEKAILKIEAQAAEIRRLSEKQATP